jgi:hypothetical protein
MTNELKLNHIYIEVANEPNISTEGFKLNSTDPLPSPSAYNDFFRGFYYGQQSIGYYFPLVYAGLSPGKEIANIRYDSDAWYGDYWVRDHINNYASRIGAHIYWASSSERTDYNTGKYYRKIQNILTSGGVSAKGIMITEFNANRNGFGNDPLTQIGEVCQWWKELDGDIAIGYWVEQTQIYITWDQDSGRQASYGILENQLDQIAGCNK